MQALNVSEIEAARERLNEVRRQVSRVYIGDSNAVDLMIVALLARGHVLLEGVPGIAKTTLVKAFAVTLGCSIRRVQFTPDLLPADITGTYVLNPKDGTFSLRAGPIFANVLLADEINRAPAKTQSALLEAMQERQVTIEGDRFELPDPFFVLATQNPVDLEGTYPLPEAQIDRFLVRVPMGYPNERDEVQMLRSHGIIAPEPFVVLSGADVPPTAIHRRPRARRRRLVRVRGGARQFHAQPPPRRTGRLTPCVARTPARRQIARGDQRPPVRHPRRPTRGRVARARASPDPHPRTRGRLARQVRAGRRSAAKGQLSTRCTTCVRARISPVDVPVRVDVPDLHSERVGDRDPTSHLRVRCVPHQDAEGCDGRDGTLDHQRNLIPEGESGHVHGRAGRGLRVAEVLRARRAPLCRRGESRARPRARARPRDREDARIYAATTSSPPLRKPRRYAPGAEPTARLKALLKAASES